MAIRNPPFPSLAFRAATTSAIGEFLGFAPFISAF